MEQSIMVMVANPCEYKKDARKTIDTILVNGESFFSHPISARVFHQCWIDNFHSPHKHYHNVRQTCFVVAAVRKDSHAHTLVYQELNAYQDSDYMGFALVIHDANRKLLGRIAPYSIEEVMTRGGCKNQGAATAVMHRLMCELRERKLKKIFLTCNSAMEKNSLHLPTFYGKFGFQEVWKNAD